MGLPKLSNKNDLLIRDSLCSTSSAFVSCDLSNVYALVTFIMQPAVNDEHNNVKLRTRFLSAHVLFQCWVIPYNLGMYFQMVNTPRQRELWLGKGSHARSLFLQYTLVSLQSA